MERTKTVKKLLIVLILVALIGGGGYYFFNALNTSNGSSSETKSFTVESGWGSQKISGELAKAGLINNAYVFELYVWVKGLSSKLLPGDYKIPQNLNIPQLAAMLSHGVGTDREINLTFIEGWNDKEVANYLAGKGITTQVNFFAVIQKKADWWNQYDFLADKPSDLDLEGYLFPDTYRVYRDATVEDIVQKMLDNFGKKLTPDLRAEIKRQGRTIHEVLTLASIVEKEVSVYSDRQMVADIFYKRIKAGIGLQSDATVNYATGLSTTRPTGKDLSVDSLYNTYKYKGLPPGPICNPGLEAIKAVIYPTGNLYLYFLTTADSSVIYSRTYAEHVAAKRKYLK